MLQWNPDNSDQKYCKSRFPLLVQHCNFTSDVSNSSDCSQSPIFLEVVELNRCIRRVALLVPERERKLGQGHGLFVLFPVFARVQEPRWRPVECKDRALRLQGKIEDCEQSTDSSIFEQIFVSLGGSRNRESTACKVRVVKFRNMR